MFGIITCNHTETIRVRALILFIMCPCMDREKFIFSVVNTWQQSFALDANEGIDIVSGRVVGIVARRKQLKWLTLPLTKTKNGRKSQVNSRRALPNRNRTKSSSSKPNRAQLSCGGNKPNVAVVDDVGDIDLAAQQQS